MKLYISSSRISKLDSCPQAYQFAYEENLKPIIKDAKLLFGTAVHQACTDFVTATVTGAVVEPVSIFEQLFIEETTSAPVNWPTDWGREDFLATGRVLVERFTALWPELKLTPLVDASGKPYVERKFRFSLGVGLVPGFPDVEIIITAYPDIIAIDENGEIGNIDVKTTASEYPDDFGFLAEQLTMYDLTGRTYAKELGASFGWHRYIELTRKKIPKKTGEGPQVFPSSIYPKRSDEVVQALIQKIIWQAEDILRKRFPKRPGHPASTPCGFCDFKPICYQGDRSSFLVDQRFGA